MFLKKKNAREQYEIRRRVEAYARKKDLEELERRVTRVEARVRVLNAVAQMESEEATSGQ